MRDASRLFPDDTMSMDWIEQCDVLEFKALVDARYIEIKNESEAVEKEVANRKLDLEREDSSHKSVSLDVLNKGADGYIYNNQHSFSIEEDYIDDDDFIDEEDFL